jgi:hypothetical protein
MLGGAAEAERVVIDSLDNLLLVIHLYNCAYNYAYS